MLDVNVGGYISDLFLAAEWKSNYMQTMKLQMKKYLLFLEIFGFMYSSEICTEENTESNIGCI